MRTTCIEKGKQDQEPKINETKHYIKNSAMSAFIVVVLQINTRTEKNNWKITLKYVFALIDQSDFFSYFVFLFDRIWFFLLKTTIGYQIRYDEMIRMVFCHPAT